jgi:transcriptional regulator with XRE-family HTH domain
LVTEYGSIPYMEPLLSFSHATLASVMPKPSKLALLQLPHSDETPGQRLARIRRERGFTQVELAERTGLVQTLVSDYERGKLRLNADMILRFAAALQVSTDDLLQPTNGAKPARKPSRRVLQRLERIEALPVHVQTTVLKSLDLMLKNVSPRRSSRQAMENGR